MTQISIPVKTRGIFPSAFSYEGVDYRIDRVISTATFSSKGKIRGYRFEVVAKPLDNPSAENQHFNLYQNNFTDEWYLIE